MKTIKKYTSNDNDSSSILKQKEKFDKLVDERLEEITESDKKVNPNNLIYRHTSPTADIKFDRFDNVLNILDKIREGEVSLADAKDSQIEFKLNLG